MKPNIAIDGPAGAGKSTVARLVAKKLDLIHIDTGAMYRALTVKALNQGLPFQDNTLADLARESKIRFEINNSNGYQRVICDDIDVTEAIREPQISPYVSLLASFQKVRYELTRQQQDYACQGGVVMDGRDIGTCVLPEAKFKFFLTASLEVRGKRRYKELQDKGVSSTLSEVMEEIRIRDEADISREAGPLAVAEDAEIINTDNLTITQVVLLIVTQYRGGK